jgi:hypothetical protein
MAGMFVTLPVVTWYGQITLADGAGMCFFTACLWASSRSYRQPSVYWLSGAFILGMLAALAKYNMAFVLVIPAYVALKHPQIILKAAAWVSTGLIPLVVLTLQTVQVENFIYDYLRPDEQLEHWDTLKDTGQLNPDGQADYEKLSRGRLDRLGRNLGLLWDDLTWITLGVAAIGVCMPHPLTPFSAERKNRTRLLKSLFLWRGVGVRLTGLLAAVGLLAFLVIGSLIDSGTRQLFGVVIILILFWGMGIESIGGEWGIPLRVLAGMFLLWQGWGAWLTADFRTQPDTRTATIEWFVDHTPSGTHIGSEEILWEFGRENGYTSPKVFVYEVLNPLDRLTPREWRCRGVEYLVWQGGFKVPAEAGLNDELRDNFLQDSQVVARFYPPHFTGPARAILRIRVDCEYGSDAVRQGGREESRPYAISVLKS